ncbi:hypothetical protein [Halomonas urumqiensis]|uniref:hypothetical protein n=1 Tax=Halomonas urumqiensis TaxID=1684789 RepID=UPI0019BBC68C|nr:hypothetical protein [Halomonas urumqiensis]GHE20280.1 hypothetical protein GCM10017767_08010 [Halomonas urumqiensis]
MTQSILIKAFRGELTAEWRAENPELISGEKFEVECHSVIIDTLGSPIEEDDI